MKRLALVSLVALLASPLARAADAAEPVRVEFRGEAGCPDHDAFMSRVRTRSSRVRDAAVGETAREFQVTLARQPDGRFHGELAVVDATAEGQRVRAIDGDSCEEVVDALALFTVLSVDPTAMLGADIEGTSDTSAPGVAEPISPGPPPPVNPARPVDRPEPPPKKQPSSHDGKSEIEYRAVAGFNGGIMAAGTPTPLSAASLFAELGLADGAGSGLSLRPVARLSLLMTPETTMSVPEGQARFRWTKLGLDLCPLVVRGSRSLALRPCFVVTGGRLYASGEIDEPKNVTTSFPTLGALVRGEWEPLDRVLLELAASIEMPLRRDTFYFEPNTPIYEVPATIGLVMLGGGFRFL